MRDLSHRFEHRLFLSATPHNGHSNSFAALLTLLDPQRFVRGMKVRKGDLDPIMVRRLKEDIREVRGGFPKRRVEQIDITGLPPDAPELALANNLDKLRTVRELRLVSASRAAQRAGALVICTLQQRLLSSVAAFARTIRVHREALERQAPMLPKPLPPPDLFFPPNNDDDVALEDVERALLEDAAVTAATEQVLPAAADTPFEKELQLVRDLEALAAAAHDRPDARVRWLLEWIDREMCPGMLSGMGGPVWNERRLLIFTEWEDTRRWLEGRLRHAIAHTQQAAHRIGSYTGSTTMEDRERLKRDFNAPPSRNPLRILIATDAAREGLNLQRHCRDLLHFDLPWNPSRLEQRNGRIDRKLQPAPEVFCRYFYYPQRTEDRVLQALVRKSETIRQQLGSMAQILEGRAADMLGSGIRRGDVADIVRRIDNLSGGDREAAINEELEATRERQDTLRRQIDLLQRRLQRSADQIALRPEQFRETLSASLLLAGAGVIAPASPAAGEQPETYDFPADTLARDQSWAPTLDLLRNPRERGESMAEWRARAPVRPVTFAEPGALGDDVVQLHLEHRVAQRLLARFASQGLLHLDLSRACLALGRQGDPRIVLLGRLSLFGPGAVRLHEEIVTITARWTDPTARRGPLRPYGEAGEATTLALLEEALSTPHRPITTEVRERLLGTIQADIADLRPHLEAMAAEARARAERLLAQRADRESAEMARLLTEQRSRIEAAMRDAEGPAQLSLMFPDERERRERQADQRAWGRRLEAITHEIGAEPTRIRDGYVVRASRVEPVGIVYLWPASG
jgi:Helicase conserved C-terminal domain